MTRRPVRSKDDAACLAGQCAQLPKTTAACYCNWALVLGGIALLATRFLLPCLNRACAQTKGAKLTLPAFKERIAPIMLAAASGMRSVYDHIVAQAGVPVEALLKVRTRMHARGRRVRARAWQLSFLALVAEGLLKMQPCW